MDEKMRERISQTVSQWIAYHKISYRLAARRLNISEQTLYRILREGTVSLQVLERLNAGMAEYPIAESADGNAKTTINQLED